MKEIIDLRTPREKHFLNEDGTYTLYAYEENIHFLKDGKYIEKNNTIIEKDNHLINQENDFSITFAKNPRDSLLKVNKNKEELQINLENKNIEITKKENHITYKNILPNIDIQYDIYNNKVKDTILLKEKNNAFKSLQYKIHTSLFLQLTKEGSIEARNRNNKICFSIAKPTLVDKNNTSHSIGYLLEKTENDYLLSFSIQKELLENETLYPFTIDPSIEVKEEDSVMDTYIYPGDEGINRNNQDMLKVGVDKNNCIYRSLIKFRLPNLGTASNVISAYGYLMSHKDNINKNDYYAFKKIDVHAITTSWEEATANWKQMHDNYDKRIEDTFYPERSILQNNTLTLKQSAFNITNLVKEWYSGKENNGLLLKFNREAYNPHDPEYSFYSKNNNAVAEFNIQNPKPYLEIVYRNQNGLENYMTYQNLHFNQGISYINNLTGNITNTFELNRTLGNKNPIQLNLIYNTNDKITDHEYGLCKGFKFNYYQILKEETIGYASLKYIDTDGSIHYFYEHTEEDGSKKIIDEDGLGLTATKENDLYILTDKSGNKMEFSLLDNLYYLTKIINTSQYNISISYDENHKIIKIMDGNQEEINISYEENRISIISPYLSTILEIENDKITAIKNKFGTTTFAYNECEIISDIIDTNGKKIHYDYYATIPYRLQKIIEYGVHNEEGTSLEFTYLFNATKIKDNKGRINTYTFNTQGNTIEINNLGNTEDFNNSYGNINEYYDNTEENPYLKNKLTLETTALKYTKNYLTDSSFEEKTYQNSSTDCARTGNYSLKIVDIYTIDLPKIPKLQTYTFSGYFKTTEENSTLALYEEEQKIKEIQIFASATFTRYSITEKLSPEKNYQIQIATQNENGILYMDDMQLEEGEIANYHNLIENSDFSNQSTHWQYMTVGIGEPFSEPEPDTSGPVILENGQTAYKIGGRNSDTSELYQAIQVSGKAQDIYQLSFWYKNNGIFLENSTLARSHVSLSFRKKDGEIKTKVFYTNINPTEWQFFQKTIVLEEDYDYMTLTFTSSHDVGDFYFTNITLTKDLENTSYQYDANGNLIATNNKNKGVSEFKYDKNNQLTSMFEPKGNSFFFEYDNDNTSKVLQGISKKGIANKIKYDENNNPIKTRIQNNDTTELNHNSFYIRLKATDSYITPDYNTLSILLKKPTCSNDCWVLEKIENTNDYYIKSSIIPLYLEMNTNSTIFHLSKTPKDTFEIAQNENGSYSFKQKEKDLYLTAQKDYFVGLKYDKDNENQQFYLEPFESKEYIETTASYTTDGKFIKTTTDALGKVTEYDIDVTTGLTKSITDPNGETTYYTYNAKEQITKVEKENKATSYTYNEQDLLEKITCDNKEYNFTYDEFLNAKQVSINNQVLVTNEYEEKNGNLISANYGNNTNISYTYDELDRIKTLTKNNKVYQYKYDNQNNLAKITQNNDTYNFYYDFAERLSRYENNNFSIDYDYDLNNNITKKTYNLENQTQEITYTYDEDDSIIKVTLDNTNQNLIYDKLGRLTNKNIDNQLPVEYEYYKNGNKTSLVLKSMKIDNDLYEYIYDAIYNITDIYKNKELINHYEYDNFSELIKEDNYQNNKTITYTYDSSGNILTRQEYTINTKVLIHQDTYEYKNNNWKDQLTKYNDTKITYDTIGNPLTIGNANLSWYARELQTYQDNMFNISYFYNKEGIRTKKRVNNIDTNYFLENSNIIFEETNGNRLYYLRTGENELLGFIYNGEKYYYKKNYQGDIIGIYNQDYKLIATYEYDSWGKILSIKDNNGAYITNSNHIAIINPFRYRSYYYDSETNLYYLNSRYYNPEWGRFLNADGIIGTNESYLGYNLYAYCDNNPIVLTDNIGTFGLKKIGATLAKVASTVIKPIISPIAAAGSVLIGNIINRPIAGELFASSFLDGVTAANTIKNKVGPTIKNNKEVQTKIDKNLNKHKSDNTTICYTEYMNFTQGDLYLSVGKMDIVTSMIEAKDHYLVTVSFVDTYNFDEIRQKKDFGSYMNNVGYYLQHTNMITPYTWDYTYSYFIRK